MNCNFFNHKPVLTLLIRFRDYIDAAGFSIGLISHGAKGLRRDPGCVTCPLNTLRHSHAHRCTPNTPQVKISIVSLGKKRLYLHITLNMKAKILLLSFVF